MNGSSVLPPMPADTVQVAQKEFAEGSVYFVLADEMENLFALCISRAPNRSGIGDPIRFLRCAVITLLQEAEALSDRQAEKATRVRLEWRYVLRLPLQHIGFPAREFCLFRQSLFADPAAGSLFDAIRKYVADLDLKPTLCDQATPYRQALSRVCKLSQTDWFAEAMGEALEALASLHPELLRSLALPHWYTQYGAERRGRLVVAPSGAGNPTYEEVRKDISYLLSALATCGDEAPGQLPEVRRLRRTLQQHCDLCDQRDRVCVACMHCVVGTSLAGWHD